MKKGEEDGQVVQRCWENFLSVGVGSRGVFGRSRLVGGLGVAIALLGLSGVDGGALVADIGDEATLVISVIGHGLDAAVGKVDTVRTLNNTVVVLALALLEVGASVAIVNTVLVGEGLGRELLLLVSLGRVVRGRGVSLRGRVIRSGVGGHGHGDGGEGRKSNEDLKFYKWKDKV